MISKSREIFDPAAQALKPEFLLHLSLLGYLLRGGSGERMTNAAIPDLYVPPRSRARSQRERERERNHAKNRSGGKGRTAKNLRDFWSRRPHQKSPEILEPLAFLKGSKISEILEPVGSPQEAF